MQFGKLLKIPVYWPYSRVNWNVVREEVESDNIRSASKRYPDEH